MKDRIRRSWQGHAPGAAELVVEEHGPFQTNAIENVGENVHACYVGPRTIGHKIWTIGLWRPRSRRPRCPLGDAAMASEQPKRVNEPDTSKRFGHFPLEMELSRSSAVGSTAKQRRPSESRQGRTEMPSSNSGFQHLWRAALSRSRFLRLAAGALVPFVG